MKYPRTDKTFAPESGKIFVFGSNLRGAHGGGAARFAHDKLGALMGCAQGPTGQSYAIPTKDFRIETLPLADIANYVGDFLAYAAEHPEIAFFVTRIGCGLAGLDDEQIAPMFAGATPNVELPDGWT